MLTFAATEMKEKIQAFKAEKMGKRQEFVETVEKEVKGDSMGEAMDTTMG
jgi:hypothetical protein